MVTDIPPPDPEAILRQLCEDMSALVARVAAVEGLLLLAGADIVRMTTILNGMLKYTLAKPGFDEGRLRLDLQDIWRRWKSLEREATKVAAPKENVVPLRGNGQGKKEN